MQGGKTYKYRPLSYLNNFDQIKFSVHFPNFDQIKFSLHFPIYITELIGRTGGK
jgi:hypothetical protein